MEQMEKGDTCLLSEKPIITMCLVLFGLNLENWFSYMMKEPRAKWKLGKIIRLYPGGDGVIRTVQLKTSIGLLNRPVVKSYPSELGSTKDLNTLGGHNTQC